MAELITKIENALPPLEPLKAVVLSVALLAIFYVMLTMSLQLSCWFALVNTTFKRCAKLTILLIIPTAIAWAVTVWSFWDVRSAAKFPPERIALIAIVWIFVLTLCGYCTRSVLQCRWRSVVTIYVMFNLSANIVSAVAVAMAVMLMVTMNLIPRPV